MIIRAVQHDGRTIYHTADYVDAQPTQVTIRDRGGLIYIFDKESWARVEIRADSGDTITTHFVEPLNTEYPFRRMTKRIKR